MAASIPAICGFIGSFAKRGSRAISATPFEAVRICPGSPDIRAAAYNLSLIVGIPRLLAET